MEIEQEKNNEFLLNTLHESRSFKRNRLSWSIFYVTSVATVIMFIIIVALSAWSIAIGQQITELVLDMQTIMPQAKDSLRIVREMCQHENFTKKWGDIC